MSSYAASLDHRRRPSSSAGSVARTLWPASGGTWFVTSWVLTLGSVGGTGTVSQAVAA